MHQLATNERIFVKFGTGTFIERREIIRLIKIGQKYRTLYMYTRV